MYTPYISNKIIYYYQEFKLLKPLIEKKFSDIYIYISSVHFGKSSDNTPYIHINDTLPNNQNDLWDIVKDASNNNITIMLMIGGAGGAYGALFSDFETYYKLLFDLNIKFKDIIKGVDLDIEEYVDLIKVRMLIDRLSYDFGEDFIITMAPIAPSMYTDENGMGGFSYKDLYNSPEGQHIDWFNVQCYGDYTLDIYQSIIKNGYPPNKIVFGMLGDNYDTDSFKQALTEIDNVLTIYPDMGGCVLWEYSDTRIDPIIWGSDIYKIFNKSPTLLDWVCNIQ